MLGAVALEEKSLLAPSVRWRNRKAYSVERQVILSFKPFWMDDYFFFLM